MLNRLFYPVVLFLNQLKYSLKFSVVGIVLLMPALIASFFFIKNINEDIAFVENELNGLEVIAPLKNLSLQLENHRTFQSWSLQGHTDAEPAAQKAKEALTSHLEKVSQAEKSFGQTWQLHEAWLATQKTIETALAQDTQDPALSLEAHTTALQSVIDLVKQIGASSELILDPQADSYMLIDQLVNKLVPISEKVGQIRAQGIRLAGSSAISTLEKGQLISLDNLTEDNQKDIETYLGLIYKENDSLKTVLDKPFQNFHEQTESVQTFLRDNYINSDAASQVTSVQAFDMSTPFLTSVYDLFDVEFKAAKTLLEKRHNDFLFQRNVLLIGLGVTVLLIIYIFVGFYKSIVSVVSELQTTTEAIAKGNLTVLTEIKTKDEMQHVGQAFNQMVQSFNQLVKEILSRSAQVSTSSEALSSTSTQMETTADKMANLADSTAKLTEELEMSIQTVAAAVEQSSANISELAKGSEKVQENVTSVGNVTEALSKSIQNIAKSTDTVTKAVDNVSQATQNISNAVSSLTSTSAEMADSVNLVASKVEEVKESTNTAASAVEEITASVNTVAAATEEMSATFNTVAENMRDINNDVQQVAKASDEMNTAVTTVAKDIEAMSVELNSVAKHTSEGAKISVKGEESTEVAQHAIDELGQCAKEIESVVEVIKSIAAQTNLLALNATIEAASAGEAGKGFAVVANEVKALAQQATNSTEIIEAQINRIQNSTQETITTIGSISNIMKELKQINTTVASSIADQTQTATRISKHIEKAADASKEVNQSIRNVAQASNVISENVENVVSTSQEVSSNIQGIAVATQEASQTIISIYQATEYVNDKSTELVMATNELRESVSDVSKATVQVNQHMSAITQSTQHVASDINDVAQRTESIVKQVEEAVGGVKLITRNIEEIANGASEIAKHSSKAAQNATGMVKSVEEVKSSTQDTFEGSKHTKDSADNLLQLSQKLEQSAKIFKIS